MGIVGALDKKIRHIKNWWFTGFVLLGVLGLWLWLAPQVFLSLPRNFSFRTDLVTISDQFDEQIGQYAGAAYSNTGLTYETSEVHGEDSIIKNSLELRTPDGQPTATITRHFGIDRRTGKHVPGLGDHDRNGYLFAPRNLKQGQPFTFWHVSYDAPANMQYQATERLHGLKVYRYITHYEGYDLDIAQYLPNVPGVGTTRTVKLQPKLEVWVEPDTGRIVQYYDDTIGYFYDLTTGQKQQPWGHFTNTLSDDAVEANATSLIWEKSKAQFVQQFVPLILLLMILFCFMQALGLRQRVSRWISPHTLLRFTAWVMIVTGLTALAGWIFDINLLKRPLPSNVVMNPFTGALFVVLGIGVLFRDKKQSRISLVAGLVLLTVGLLRLASIFGVVSFQIDLVLFKDLVLQSSQNARMAEYTALSSILLGIALIAPLFKSLRRLRVAEVVSLTVFALSSIALFGMLFASLDVFLMPQFFLSAAHATMLFLFSASVLYEYSRLQDEHSVPVRSWMIIATLLFFFVWLTVAAAGRVDSVTYKQSQQDFNTVVNDNAQAITNHLSNEVGGLRSGVGLFAASDAVTRSEWQRFVEGLGLGENYAGIQGMGYSILVRADDLARHTAATRSEGLPGYTVNPPSTRDTYSPVLFIEPMSQENQKILGYDMFANTSSSVAMKQALDSGEPRLSERVTYEQIGQNQPGFLIYLPVFANGLPHASPSERTDALQGWVFGAFQAKAFVQTVIGQEGLDDIAVSIYDGSTANSAKELYSDTSSKLKNGEVPRFTETITVYLAGRPWTMVFVSTPSYGVTDFARRLPLSVITAGLTISMLLIVGLFVLMSSRQRAVEYAEEVTGSLRDANEKLEEAQRISKMGNFSWDLKTQMMYWSDGLFRIHQLKPTPDNAAPNRHWYDEHMVHPEDLKPARAAVLRLMTTPGEFSYVYRVILPNKSIRYLRIRAEAERDAQGRPVALNGTSQDITKEAEIDQAKDEFVSLASHQLRSPLSAINWYTEMLLAGDAGKLNTEQKELLDEVYEANDRMTELVGALLNTSRLDLGTFIIDPKPTDILKIVKSVIVEQRPLVLRKHLTIKTDFDKELPTMQADPQLLRIVLQNLISNAIKYTPDNGTVSVAINVDKDNFNFIVTDTGYGIPTTQKDKIFEKLFRADNVKQKNVEGTGLGLYIVKQIVDKSGGKIWFESVENRGTSFFVTFPLTGMKEKKGDKQLN